jgi:Tfp pilus assembly protein PilE
MRRFEWREADTRGFTMIELTTVGIMILILISIALPNFLEAQIRARVTAAQSDATLLSQCLEEYYIANRAYPANRVEKLPDGGLAGDGDADLRGYALTALTTPVVYLSTLLLDPFFVENESRKVHDYINFVDWTGGPISRETLGGRGSAAYLVGSVGPDRLPITVCAKRPATSLSYSPSNGSVSPGDILVLGP